MKLRSEAYALLLAGGSGERLWPLSRRSKPKQLLEINGYSLLEHTVERVEPLFAPEQIQIITTEQHAQAIQNVIGTRVGSLCIEPVGRNTAPAIYLGAVTLREKVTGDPVIAVMPTDHYIDAPQAFSDFLVHALDSARMQDALILLGIEPTWAATGYGYIEYHPGEMAPYAVRRFHEKPQQKQAEEYVAAKNFLWNSGMLCARLSVLLHAFEKNAPEIVHTVDAYRKGTGAYAAAPSISNDYALLEKSKNLLVLPAQFPWCDVGSLETFLALTGRGKNQQEVIEIDSHNNFFSVKDGVIALVGVEDLCIVQTEGILFITKRGQTERVRAVVEQLKLRNKEQYLE